MSLNYFANSFYGRVKAAITSLQSAGASLASRVSAVETAAGNGATAISNLQGRINTAESNISNGAAAIGSLASRVSVCEAVEGGLSDRIATWEYWLGHPAPAIANIATGTLATLNILGIGVAVSAASIQAAMDNQDAKINAMLGAMRNRNIILT